MAKTTAPPKTQDPRQILDPDGKAVGKVPSDLSKDDLRTLFRAMVTGRLFDQRGMNLQRQGRTGFFAPGLGQEASQLGVGWAIDERDWLFPSYRMHAVALLKGVPVGTMLDQLWGNANDLSKGRQMPNHFSFRQINWVSISSPIGTQISHAVGAARAAQIRGDDTVSWAFFGDGGTSSNDFHAGMNFAGVWKAPCVFVCENNQWAISVPQEKQTASESFAIKAKAYGMNAIRVDGNDVFAVYQAAKEARDHAVAGNGPTLIETVTFRMGPHSSSDDPSRYQPKGLKEEWEAKDPIERYRTFLKSKRIWTRAWEDEFTKAFQDELSEAVERAESTPAPAIETMFEDVYAEVPKLLAEQRDTLLEQIAKSGEIEDTGGAFPL